MDKTVTSLIAALSAVAAAAPSHAAPVTPAAVHEALEFSSYADLLKPIPNAVAILKQTAEAEEAAPSDGEASVETVQFYYHHHHHRFFRRRYHHHHHHHYHRYY